MHELQCLVADWRGQTGQAIGGGLARASTIEAGEIGGSPTEADAAGPKMKKPRPRWIDRGFPTKGATVGKRSPQLNLPVCADKKKPRGPINWTRGA